MPSYKGHLLGGIATFAAIASLPCAENLVANSNVITSFGALSACLLGSLFPDIDTQSKGRRIFVYSLGIGIAIALARNQIGLATFFLLMGIFPLFVRHRSITHNPLFLAGAPLFVAKVIGPAMPLVNTVPIGYYIFFVAGAFSHIALDFLPYKLFGIRIKQKRWTKKKDARHFR